MPETVDKAVWLESLGRVEHVIRLMELIYDTNVWTGGLLFQDLQGGFLLVACFDPDQYMAFGTPWERLFPERDLRPLTLEEALANNSRYRPWFTGDITMVLRHLKLLPTLALAPAENHPTLAQIRTERDPARGLP